MRLVIIFSIVLMIFSFDGWTFDCCELKEAWKVRKYLKDSYYKQVGNNYGANKEAADIINELLMINNAIYQRYIKYMFFEESQPTSCICLNENDPLIKLINIYSSVIKGKDSFDNLGKIMINEPISVLWEMDKIVFKGESPLSKKWIVEYHRIPSFYLINGLFNSITVEDKYALKYLLMLFDNSDGFYADYLHDEVIWDLFIQKPKVVLSNFSQINRFSDRIKNAFRGDPRFPDERIEVVKKIYKKYPKNENAKTILKWLSFKKFKNKTITTTATPR